MRRHALILAASLATVASVAWILAIAFGGDEATVSVERPPADEQLAGSASTGDDANGREVARERAEHAAMLDREFPMHGVVTAPQIPVRTDHEPEAQVVGWLRLGGHVRARPERVVGPRCNTGWYALYPRGWACAGQGIDMRDDAPADELGWAADRAAALPYRYLVVTQPQTPEYHQLPSREAQRQAAEHGARYAQLLDDGQERRAALLREGRLANEPSSPAVVVRYLHRGFYVAGAGVETRSQRRFVRTVRGSYVREAELEERTGADFAGVVLTEPRTLPIAWAVRESQPMRRVVHPDQSVHFRPNHDARTWSRQEILPWLRREREGDRVYHVIETDGGEGYLRSWFAAVAERIDPPAGVRDDEPWVHVDVSEQTLVLYRGATPIYATLASTGLDGHDTPRGEFRIRRKFVSDTMANLGPDAGDDSYRIDDVPWTQYFEGSFALHGAFWHHRFGLQRSHGCVNLAPRDARYVFERTWPEIPQGWHGVSTERGAGFEGSRVLVTD